jgi:anti-anti-sigma regulatory factor
MNIETDGDSIVVSFPDTKALDEASVRLVSEKLAAGAAGKSVVLNLAGVEQASSAALAELMLLQNKIVKSRGTLALSNVTDDFRKLLKSLAMDKMFGLQKPREAKKAPGGNPAIDFATILYRGDKNALASLESALKDWRAFYGQHAKEIGVDFDWLKQIWEDKANPWEVLIDVGCLHNWVFEADHAECFDEIVAGLRTLQPVKSVSLPWDELAKTEPETDIEEFFAEVSAKLRPHKEALVILDKGSDSYPLAMIRLDALKKAKRLADQLEDAEVVVPGQDD